MLVANFILQFNYNKYGKLIFFTAFLNTLTVIEPCAKKLFFSSDKLPWFLILILILITLMILLITSDVWSSVYGAWFKMDV